MTEPQTDLERRLRRVSDLLTGDDERTISLAADVVARISEEHRVTREKLAAIDGELEDPSR